MLIRSLAAVISVTEEGMQGTTIRLRVFLWDFFSGGIGNGGYVGVCDGEGGKRGSVGGGEPRRKCGWNGGYLFSVFCVKGDGSLIGCLCLFVATRAILYPISVTVGTCPSFDIESSIASLSELYCGMRRGDSSHERRR